MENATKSLPGIAFALALLVMPATGCAGSAGDPPDAGDAVDATVEDGIPEVTRALPALPLRTSGRFVVDARGNRFKLAGVNWAGAEHKGFVPGGLHLVDVDTMAQRISGLGFNSVRLLFSNQMVESNPIVDDAYVAANPALKGLRALEVFDATIAALTRAGVVVILDNHISDAGWCCTGGDDNYLWYNARYPEAAWMADWVALARRYRDNPAVVGAELRNELRVIANWDGLGPELDWAPAAERAGNAVLAEAPNWLIVVDGVAFSRDLQGAKERPIVLAVPDRLVYAAHDYRWFSHTPYGDYAKYKRELDDRWGYLLEPGNSYTAPVWMNECGSCNQGPECVDSDVGNTDGLWSRYFRRYLAENDVDWSWWIWNGSHLTPETGGNVEGYGILDPTWSRVALPAMMEALRPLMP
jgi:endoglucanase